jgi:hypothetical protein
MPLASHLGQRDVPVAVVNPLAATVRCSEPAGSHDVRPADARSFAEMGMRDTPAARDPLAGVELRPAARFAMTPVAEQAKVCQRGGPPDAATPAPGRIGRASAWKELRA